MFEKKLDTSQNTVINSIFYMKIFHVSIFYFIAYIVTVCTTGELGYDGLNGTRKIGPSYAKSVVYI